jgi:hypothetical protein
MVAKRTRLPDRQRLGMKNTPNEPNLMGTRSVVFRWKIRKDFDEGSSFTA